MEILVKMRTQMFKIRLKDKLAWLKTLMMGLLGVLGMLWVTGWLSTAAFAVDGQITLTTDADDLIPGQEVTVSVQLPEGVTSYALTATLQYDENVFETLTTSDFDVPETTHVSYNPDNQEFGLVNQAGAVGQNLLAVRLRVRDDPGVGDTNIALVGVTSSDGAQQTRFSPAVATVSVNKDAADGVAVAPISDSQPVVDAEARSEGVFTTVPLVVAGAILLVAIVAGGVYVLRNSRVRKPKLLCGLVGLGAVVLVGVAVTVNLNQGKKDVNGDGQVGYDDAVAIVDYLIRAEGTADEAEAGEDFGGSVGGENGADGASTGVGDGAQAEGGAADGRDGVGVVGSGSSSTEQTPAGDADDGVGDDENGGDLEAEAPVPQPSPGDFDTNNDGKVDVNDAGHNAEQAQKATTVALAVAEEQPAYVEKGTKELKFVAKVEPSDVALESVTFAELEGKHNVNCVGETCTVEIPVQTVAGEQTFTIIEATTSNQKTFSLDFAVGFEVLKDVPTLANIDQDEEQGKVSFRLVDPDQALTSGEAKIYDHLQQNVLAVASDLQHDVVTTLTYHGFEEGEDYRLIVDGDYCRTVERDTPYCYADQNFYAHDFMMLKEYAFDLRDFYVSDYVDLGSYPTVTFVGTNNVGSPVYQALVRIDQGEPRAYNVTRADGDRYEIVLEGADVDPGVHHVVLESVTIDKLKTFTNQQHYNAEAMAYKVPMATPEVEDLVLDDNKEAQAIRASFKVKSGPCTEYFMTGEAACVLAKINVVMTDSAGTIVASQKIGREQLYLALTRDEALVVNLSYATNGSRVLSDRRFTVKILADYDLGGKYNFTDKQLAEATISAFDEDGLTVEDVYTEDTTDAKKIVSTRYATKGQKTFRLVYQPKPREGYLIPSSTCSNSYSDQSSVTINNLNYPVYNPGKTNYRAASLRMPDEAGVIELKISRLQYMVNGYYCKVNDWYAIPEYDYQVEVLKDVPRIANLEVKDEDYAGREVTLAFDVVLDPKAVEGDNSFEEGTVMLGADAGRAQPMQRGHNEVTFTDVQPDQMQGLVFSATYDLDTDALNDLNGGRDDNYYQNRPLLVTAYGLYPEEVYQGVAIEDPQAHSASSRYENHYFEKNEEVNLDFAIVGIDADKLPTGLGVVPSKVVVKNQEYELTRRGDAGYRVVLPGFAQAGKKTYSVTAVVFSNGKRVQLAQPVEFGLEVLKDAPTVTGFTYAEQDGKVKTEFRIDDSDGALVGQSVATVRDEDDGSEVYRADLGEGAQEVEFDKRGDHYVLSVVAEYSRVEDGGDRQADFAGQQYWFDNATLLETTISLADRLIELKEIVDVNLYHALPDGGNELVDETDAATVNQDLDNYFVEIVMQSMPTVRVKLRGAEVRDGHLILTITGDYLTIQGAPQTDEPELDYGEVDDGGKARNEYHPATAFRSLLERLNAGQDVTLERDYDASSVTVDQAYYAGNYSKTLNGNGHVIRNLQKPLFNTLDGGTVENLVLEHVTLNSLHRGALANQASRATVRNVIVRDVTSNNSQTGTGGLIGPVDGQTMIEACGVTGMKLNVGWNVQQVGGITGSLNNGSRIKNSYAIGKIAANWNYIGGLVGSTSGTAYIDHSYAKVDLNNAAGSNGLGSSYGGQLDVANSVSLSTNYKGVPISGRYTQLSDNFYLDTSEADDREGQGTRLRTVAEVNADFFREQVGFDADVWRLDADVSYDNPPRLRIEKQTASAIEEADGYNVANVVAYNNLQKLMPYYEYSRIVEVGNRLDDEAWRNHDVKHLIPLDDERGLVTYLTADNPGRVATLRVVFDDGVIREYQAFYDRTYDMVANYRLPELGLDYNYPHYLINNATHIVDNLTHYLQGLDYMASLDTLTGGADSRIYRDFYNETTRNELREFVLKYLANSNLANATDSRGVSTQLERKAREGHRIEKALYVYNYLRRFYDLDFGNLKLYDVAMFGMQGFDADYGVNQIVDRFFGDNANFDTALTEKTFLNVYGNDAGIDGVAEFIELVAGQFASIDDMDAWARDQFKGYLVEVPVTGHEAEVQYTLWDHLSNRDEKYGGYGDNAKLRNHILPILTLPANSTYIVSMPVEFVIGSQRTYIADPDDPAQQGQLALRAGIYRERVQNYFDTAFGILQDPETFNNIHTYQVDTRVTKDGAGASVYNTAGATTDPFIKNYNEVLSIWAASDGNAAVATGDRINWSAESFMGSVFDPLVAQQLGTTVTTNSYHTFTHESAHNIDARLFLYDNGRRFDAGGEDYADSYFMQNFGQNDIVMNLSIADLRTSTEGGSSNDIYGSNYQPSTINSKENIWNYYRNLFDAIYVLDYIEAQAFLELDADTQATVSAQVSYPNATGFEKLLPNEGEPVDIVTVNAEELHQASPTVAPYRAYMTTTYTRLPAERFEEMQLETIDDLYRQRIVITPGLYDTISRRDNQYGGEGYNTVHWYQPHNNYGRPDSYSLKWLSYEMLGLRGYDEGLVEYGSNINSLPANLTFYLDTVSNGVVTQHHVANTVQNYKSDAMALQRIAGTDDFGQYKHDRFAEVAAKLNTVNGAVDVQDYARKFYEALKKDAEESKANIQALIERKGSIDNCRKDYWCNRSDLPNAVGLRNSTQLRQTFLKVLKEQTADFTAGAVFTHEKAQDFDDAEAIRDLVRAQKRAEE